MDFLLRRKIFEGNIFSAKTCNARKNAFRVKSH